MIVEEAAPPAEPPALVRTRLLSLASVAVVCALFVLFALPHDPARSPVATPAPSPEPSRVVAAPARVPPGFFTLDNAVIFPHVASATQETRKAMGDLQIENLRLHFAGKPVRTRVV